MIGETGSRSGGDPYLQGRLRLRWQGETFTLLAPHSVFSASRIDDGTRLLLDHLPPGEPETFLDLGCGYGALGLPVAVRFLRSRGVLIDRDLLAVEYARRNAALLRVSNAHVLPGLGFRSLPEEPSTFDWILCNAPARAGEGVLAHFLAEGMTRLRPGGELRLVIIAPLAGTVERAAKTRGLACARVAESSRHAVFRLARDDSAHPNGEQDEEVYLRDRIRLELPERLDLLRPTDLADEPHRLAQAIPLLASHLPRKAPSRALVFRCGYGLVPALLLARYPGVSVTALDRDLLGAAFTRLNCRHYLDRLQVAEAIEIEPPECPFDLILGELLPPLGPAATLREVERATSVLGPGGSALMLGLLKQWREVLEPASERLGLTLRDSRAPVGLFEARGVDGPRACGAPGVS